MEISREEIIKNQTILFKKFNELNIDSKPLPYPVSHTVEEGKELRGNMKGTFTKNLLLKDKKHQLFLISVFEDQEVNLKKLHKSIGANGRLSFASDETMIDLLGVIPGSLTPLGIINDKGNQVKVVIDKDLLDKDQVNFHPLINTESIGLSSQELLLFIKDCGHDAIIVDFNEDVD